MKQRSFFYFLAAIIIVLLLVGIAGFYWLFTNSPLGLSRSGSSSPPSATIFVSKQAPAMVSLLIDPERLVAWQQVLVSPENRERSHIQLDQLKQSLLANTNLDYQRDIQPWLGSEITLAVTNRDLDRDPENGFQPGYLAVVSTRDSLRSLQFLESFWQTKTVSGQELAWETYQGVKLIYTKPESALASAVVGDRFILFANHPKVLRDAINNVQAGGLSLSSDPAYLQALKNLNQSKIGLVFINLSNLADWIDHQSAPITSDLEAPQLYDSLAIALELDQQGILAETALIAAAHHEITPTSPDLLKPVPALQYLPAKTAFSIAGKNLGQLWSQISGEITADPSLARLINPPLVTAKNNWHIDLPKDIFNWVGGEYVVGLLPRVSTPAQIPSFDWIFVTQKPADLAPINSLDAIAVADGFSVGPLTLGNQEIITWTRLTTVFDQVQQGLTVKAEVKGVHTTIGDYEIFTTSVQAMADILAAPGTSLLNSPKFQETIGKLPQPNDGYVYVDWSATEPILAQQFPVIRLIELVAKPLISNWESLSISSQGAESSIRHASAFIHF